MRFGVASTVVLLLVGPAWSRSDSGLHDAARAGDLVALESLLAAGADPRAAGRGGEAALHVAAARGHVELVRRLIGAGVPIDGVEFDGDTALVNAAWFGHAEVVRVLLEAGADPSITGSVGAPAIDLARQRGHSKAVRVLREFARRPNAAEASSPRSPQATRVYRPGYARRIAVVIGVNEYASWPDLHGARGDAERVAKRLRELEFDEVFELYDGAATRAAILDLLGNRLRAQVGPDDLVVVFFAGHGDTETVEAGRKRGYIVPVDARIGETFSSAIAMRELRALADRLPAKHVYYAMDSCYSGLGFSRGLGVVQPGANDYFEKVTSLRAVQMVTAGGEGEEAIERDGAGVFTRSFLDALDGAADANGDGFVTATEIGAYVAPRVTNETRARQSPQAGRLEGEGEVAFEVRRRR